VLVAGYLWRVLRMTPLPKTRRVWACLLVAGLVIYLGGFLIFLSAQQAQSTALGIANRTAMVSSIGVAALFLSFIGFATTFLRNSLLRRGLFTGSVAALCAAGTLITLTVSQFWISASLSANGVLHSIARNIPHLPHGSTLLLDGICPYDGPAVVFETGWDLQGALRTMYRHYAIEAHPITPVLRVEEDAIVSSLYHGAIVERYRYAGMFVYDVGRGVVHPLSDASEARAYLEQFRPRLGSDCPRGEEGFGVAIIPRRR
jgi:hypothetical protein